MFNSFPQPKPDASGGLPSILDWSAYDTVYDWSGTTVSVPLTSWYTFVDVSGSGYLTFVQAIAALSTAAEPNVRVTIDGSPYVFNGFNTASTFIGNIIMHPIYFKSRLKIELYNKAGSSASLGCDYSYLLKQQTPTSNQSILLAGSRNEGYGQTTSLTLTDIVNISGSGYLLGALFSGWYSSAGGIVKGNVVVDSVTKMTSRNLFDVTAGTNKTHYFHGPIRFESSLQVQHLISTSGGFAQSRVFYTLD